MINKKLYTECVKTLVEFNRKDLAIYEVTNGTVDFVNCNELLNLISAFTQLLEYCTKDEDQKYIGSNLQYFVYDLDGGKNYKPGDITDEVGAELSCSNVEDLWNNFIIKDHPEIEDKTE